MHVAIGVGIWVLGAIAIWFYLQHRYGGESSEIYIPFPLIVAAIALWPVTLVVIVLAMIIEMIITAVCGSD